MEKKYTSEEVIDLFNQFMKQASHYKTDLADYNHYFTDWLKKKEQSEFPVKGQIIWVRDSESFASLPTTWIKAKFIEFTPKGIYAQMENGSFLTWDEYSLTDPEHG